MNNVKWVSKDSLFSSAIENFLPTDVLLDIGCGIMPQQFIVPSVHICAEPYMEYVDELQKKLSDACDRSYVILNSTWEEVLSVLPPKSVDTVVLADVIEHLEKDAASALIRKTEALARQQILIFTPLGFLPQSHPDGIDAWGMGGADWQEHKSGWEPTDFGADWKIIATKEYYFNDNLGRPFEKPYGAFWAIRRFGVETSANRIEARNFINQISVFTARLNCPSVVKWNVVLLKVLAALWDSMRRLKSIIMRIVSR